MMDAYNSFFLGPFGSIGSFAGFLNYYISNENNKEAVHDSSEDLNSTNVQQAFESPIDPQTTPVFLSGSNLFHLQPHNPIDPNLVANIDLSEEEAIFEDIINQSYPPDSKEFDFQDHSGYVQTNGHRDNQAPEYTDTDRNDDGEYELELNEEQTSQPVIVEKKGPAQSLEPMVPQARLPTLPVTKPIVGTKWASTRRERKSSVADEAGSDGITKKGRVNLLPGGGLEWNNSGDWIPAVYHDTLRPELIQRTDLLGIYDNLRARGSGEWDRTSYHPDQKTWGPCRFKHWPHMPDKLLFRLECNGYPVPDYKPEVWLDRGRVVLDSDNHPVKAWANIPLTLASNADPWLLGYMRRVDTRITPKDLRARMPLQVKDKKSNSKPLGSLSPLGMQMTRFRISATCPAWNVREGSNAIEEYVKDRLSEEGLAANSTEELTGLSLWQQAECKKPNKGQYLERAGGRALSANERKRRDDIETRRLDELRPQTGTDEENEVKVVQPTQYKRGSRESTSGPSTSLEVARRKRDYADIADPEEPEASQAPKRRNLGANANELAEDFFSQISEPGQTTPSASYHLGNPLNQPDVPLYQGKGWESQEQHPIRRPHPLADSTTHAVLERFIPNLGSQGGFSMTSQPATQRKQIRASYTESEGGEGLPSPKRRSMASVVEREERPLRYLPARSPRELVPHLSRLPRLP